MIIIVIIRIIITYGISIINSIPIVIAITYYSLYFSCDYVYF